MKSSRHLWFSLLRMMALERGLLRSDNLIITNWHVVQNNQFVKVAFMPKGLGAKFSEAEVAIARDFFKKTKRFGTFKT